jgi:hypothetical protein
LTSLLEWFAGLAGSSCDFTVTLTYSQSEKKTVAQKLLGTCPHIAVHPSLGKGKSALRGGESQSNRFCCFLDGKSSVESEDNQFRGRGVQFLQPVQRLLDREDIVKRERLGLRIVVERDAGVFPAAFLRPPLPRMIYQYLSHCIRRAGKKMRPVLPMGPGPAQPQVDLVHQFSRT